MAGKILETTVDINTNTNTVCDNLKISYSPHITFYFSCCSKFIILSSLTISFFYIFKVNDLQFFYSNQKKLIRQLPSPYLFSTFLSTCLAFFYCFIFFFSSTFCYHIWAQLKQVYFTTI